MHNNVFEQGTSSKIEKYPFMEVSPCKQCLYKRVSAGTDAFFSRVPFIPGRVTSV